MMDIKLAENLIKALQYENFTYGKILSLAEKKTEYLIQNDITKISEITEEENQLIDQTRQLSKVRDQLVAKLCHEKHEQRKITVEDIKKELPKELSKSLEEIQSKLKETVMRLVVRNGMNKKLIENALKYVNFNLELITSPAPSVPIYGKGGEEVSGTQKRSMLDIKY